jgi:hypothetical protein
MSPFYENTQYQFAWNSSSLGAFKECARKYQYKYILGYQRKGEGLHIRFGSLFHEALERYDRLVVSGSEPASAILDTVRFLLNATWDGRSEDDAGAPWDSGDTKKNRETLVRSVVWYIEHYNPDPAKTFILATGEPAIELAFASELPFDTPVNGDPYLYTGHIDRMVTYGDDLFITDRKTTQAAIGGYYFDRFNPDNQMTGYIYTGKVTFKVPIAGVMLDVAQIQVGATNFARAFTSRTGAQVEEWLKDTQYYTELAVRYADAQYWPLNDKACMFCDFRQVCQADPAIRPNVLKTDYEVNMHSIERILA